MKRKETKWTDKNTFIKEKEGSNKYAIQTVATKTANHPKLPKTTQNHLKSSATTQNDPQPPKVIHPKPSVFLQNHLLPPQTTSNQSESN